MNDGPTIGAAAAPRNHEESDVLVVGGSLGGLSAALALAAAGKSVIVLEARSTPPEDRWGLTLWPPAVRVLDRLGVGAEVRRRGSVLQSLRWLRGDGRTWLDVDCRQIVVDDSFVGALPSVVLEILGAAVRRAGVPIITGCQVEAFLQEAGGVSISARDGDGIRRLRARVIVASDGPQSMMRQLAGLRCRFIRIPGQYVFTGIGGPLREPRLQQTVGDGWSLSAVPMGANRSWLAVAAHADTGWAVLRRCVETTHPDLKDAVDGLQQGWRLTPASGHVRRWTVDGMVLIGDAAHAALPHLGLGGSLTLEDVPPLVDVLTDALRRGRTDARTLSRFHAIRRGKVRYAQRISLLWALVSPGPLAPIRMARDVDLWRMSRRPERMTSFLREVVDRGLPRWPTRAGVWLP